MRAHWIVTIAGLALAGCQSPEERHAAETGEINVTNATSGQVMRLMDAASRKAPVQPGMWKASMRVESAESGEGGAATVEALRRFERDTTTCRKGDDLKPFDIAALERVAGTCTFQRLVAAGGTIDAKVECTRPNGPVTAVTIHGTSTPTAFDVTTSQRTGKPGDVDHVAVRLRATGTRTGDCQG